jgi:hypothetical protein
MVGQGSFMTPTKIAEILANLSPADRDIVADAFIAAGGDALLISKARERLVSDPRFPTPDQPGSRRKRIALFIGTGVCSLVAGIIIGRVTKGS